MVAENLAFAALAVTMVIGGIQVVTTQNVVRAALYLVIVLAGVAAIYILLAAEFVAIVQVLVYIGAIVVLFLFGIMLTRAPVGRDVGLDNDQRLVGVLVALGLLGLMCWVLADGFGTTKVPMNSVIRTAAIGDSLLGPYVIPFEVVSVLLLAALVGAVAIARRD
jgi:NADH-quinone oxidoreductase subunit J